MIQQEEVIGKQTKNDNYMPVLERDLRTKIAQTMVGAGGGSLLPKIKCSKNTGGAICVFTTK